MYRPLYDEISLSVTVEDVKVHHRLCIRPLKQQVILV